MELKNSYWKLFSLWGKIDEQHNRLIVSRVSGKKVLDIGCGYGTLVEYLTKNGYEAEGIDCDKEALAVAKKLFPNDKINYSKAEGPDSYPDGYFDTIVLKDCLHHLVVEGDVKASFSNFRRLLKKGGRIVILDPNPNLLLKSLRKLILYKDPEASLKLALDVLKGEKFRVQGVEFYETIGVALSGGYVIYQLTPNWKFLNDLVCRINDALSRMFNKAGFGKYLCWRYLVYAEKEWH